jgi:alcohol dehydrogenase
MRAMTAAVFVEPGRIVLEEKPVPQVGPGDALVRITTTTICGTDVHILKGEYPVERGRIVGHEPVGVIEELGPGVTGYQVGQRVVVGAITPCGQCLACLDGHQAQCGGGTPHGYAQALGGWRFGNTIDGCQAEYVRVPYAMANLTPVPDGLTDEQVLMCPDIMSTGFGGAESGRIRGGRHRGRVRPGSDRPVRDARRQAPGGDPDHHGRHGPIAGSPRPSSPVTGPWFTSPTSWARWAARS